MTFPVVESTASYDGTTDEMSHTITLPSGVSEDDLLLIWFVNDHVDLPTTPSGWNKGYQALADSNTAIGTLYWKIAGASESNPAIAMEAAEAASAISVRISGAGGIFMGSAIDPGTSANITVHPVITNLDAADTLWLAFAGWDNGARTVSTYPYASDQVETGSASAGVGAALSTKTSNASSDSPSDFVLNAAEQTVSLLVAVREPSAGGGGTTVIVVED